MSRQGTCPDDDATNATDLAGALAAGPHYLASDHVVASEGSDYVASLPDGSPRCHPARVTEGCGAAVIEGP